TGSCQIGHELFYIKDNINDIIVFRFIRIAKIRRDIILKVKNPYSKRRKTRKEKLNLKITKIITPYIKKISTVIIEKRHTKFIPESLYIAKETIERSWEREKIWKNKKPEDIQLTLERVYIADYMPIENVDVFNKGLKRLFSKKRAPFQ